jgi:hypothetical protein
VDLRPEQLRGGFLFATNYPIEWYGTLEQARRAVGKKVQKLKAPLGQSFGRGYVEY